MQQNRLSIITPPFAPTLDQAALITLASLPVKDSVKLLMASRKGHVPEWKVSQVKGDPFQWHELFGQFKSAIDSANLMDNVKRTFSEALVSRRAKSTTAEFP